MAGAYVRHASSGRRRRIGTLRLVAAAAVAAVLVGGYQEHWSWTGISGKTATLWDWINLLLLPLVIATFPVWPEIRQELRLHHHLVLTVVAVGLAVAVFGGYVWGWAWTGFQGNTLWDWLHLLILPLVFPTLLLPAALAITAGELMRDESQAPDSASIAP